MWGVWLSKAWFHFRLRRSHSGNRVLLDSLTTKLHVCLLSWAPECSWFDLWSCKFQSCQQFFGYLSAVCCRGSGDPPVFGLFATHSCNPRRRDVYQCQSRSLDVASTSLSRMFPQALLIGWLAESQLGSQTDSWAGKWVVRMLPNWHELYWESQIAECFKLASSVSQSSHWQLCWHLLSPPAKS